MPGHREGIYMEGKSEGSQVHSMCTVCSTLLYTIFSTGKYTWHKRTQGLWRGRRKEDQRSHSCTNPRCQLYLLGDEIWGITQWAEQGSNIPSAKGRSRRPCYVINKLLVAKNVFPSGNGREIEVLSLFVLDYRDLINRNVTIWPASHQWHAKHYGIIRPITNADLCYMHHCLHN